MTKMRPDPMVQRFAESKGMTLGHPTNEELKEAQAWAKTLL